MNGWMDGWMDGWMNESTIEKLLNGSTMTEEMKEVFYLMTHSTHFIYGYMSHMVKDHSDSKRRNTLPLHKLLFPISRKGSFICIIPQTG